MEIPLGKFAEEQPFSYVFPVIWVLTQWSVLSPRWSFIKGGLFVRAGFFQGELLGGNFGLVFQPCFHSSWRTEAALPSCKQKGQTAVPSRQDKHTLLLGGQPHAACAGWWRRWPSEQLCFPIAVRSVPHADVGLPMHQRLAFKSSISWVYWLHLHSFLCQDASLKSQERGLLSSNPL